MKFRYQARTKTGEVQIGIVEASSKEAALNLLQKHQLYVTFLEEEKEKPFLKKRIKIFAKISRRDITLFTKQIAIMFQSGVSLTESLRALAEQTRNPDFKEKISKIADEVEGGMPFSQALSKHPQAFSSFYVEMIRSGEAAGKLSEVLKALAEGQERDYLFYSKLKGAMIYPTLVLFVFLMIFTALIYFVLPSLEGVLEELGKEPPLLTKFIFFVSGFLKKWGWILILAFFGFLVFLRHYLKTLEGRKTFDHFILKIPIINSLARKIFLSRLASTLATLLSGGLPVIRSLEITSAVVGNEIYRSIILQTKEEVKRGSKISQVLERYPEEIPPLFVKTVLVGEKTGRLDRSLSNLVSFYQREMDWALEGLVRLLEPAIIVVLGVMVGGLVISILLPLYRVGVF